MKKPGAILLLSALMGLPQAMPGQEKVLDVPYVPTNPVVVAEMLKMAHVGKNDILYDLGCGDGRIVVTAAQLYGTRGTGIDLNPERIRESRENAEKAHVTNLVKFIEGDLFQADFHEASVVTLYLLTSVNLRLRPKLLAELRPGSRVVSHDFAMGDWKSDQSANLTVDGYAHNVYFWLIPANASGVWEWTQPEGGRTMAYRLEIRQHFQEITGALTADGKTVDLKEALLSGNTIKLSAERPAGGGAAALTFEGRLTGDTIEGTVSGARIPWKARRRPATMQSIDGGTVGYRPPAAAR